MARIRSLKPEFWADEFLAEHCSRDARMLYLALWNLADEHSRTRAGARYLKGQVFAYDDDIDRSDIDRLLKELSEAERIQMYEVAGERYAYLPKLAGHQRLEPDKSKSRLPEPPAVSDANATDSPVGEISDESAPEPGGSAPGRKSSGLSMLHGSGVMVQRAPDDSGESAPKTRRKKPAHEIPDEWHPSEQLLAWSAEKYPTVDPKPEVQRFIDYHRARDNRFADIDAAWRTWITNQAKWSAERGKPGNGVDESGSYVGWRG